MPKARKVAFPVESHLHRNLDQAFYSDAFEIELVDTSLPPVEIATRALASTPAWVDGLVNLRDRIVSLFGLKTVGRLRLAGAGRSPSEPAVGDALSIFRIVLVDGSELVLGIDDNAPRCAHVVPEASHRIARVLRRQFLGQGAQQAGPRLHAASCARASPSGSPDDARHSDVTCMVGGAAGGCAP